MQSQIVLGGEVRFPAFLGERHHMREIQIGGKLPVDLARWQDTVDQMTVGIPSGVGYLMIEQTPVVGGYHRRPGLHIDGAWNPMIAGYEGSSGSLGYSHTPEPVQKRKPRKKVPAKKPARRKEALLLATDYPGCEALLGPVEGTVGLGGDCSHLEVGHLPRLLLESGVVWAGDTFDLLHESLLLREGLRRTLVRINVPGWLPDFKEIA